MTKTPDPYYWLTAGPLGIYLHGDKAEADRDFKACDYHDGEGDEVMLLRAEVARLMRDGVEVDVMPPADARLLAVALDEARAEANRWRSALASVPLQSRNGSTRVCPYCGSAWEGRHEHHAIGCEWAAARAVKP